MNELEMSKVDSKIPKMFNNAILESPVSVLRRWATGLSGWPRVGILGCQCAKPLNRWDRPT